MDFSSFEYYASTHKNNLNKTNLSITVKCDDSIFTLLTDEFIKEQIIQFNLNGSNDIGWLGFFANYIYFDQEKGTFRLGIYEAGDELFVDFINQEESLGVSKFAKLLTVRLYDLPLIQKFLYYQAISRFNEIKNNKQSYHFDISENAIAAMSEGIRERIEHTKSLKRYRD